MVQINREEAMAIRERFPNIKPVRTVHKYYVEENPRVMSFLRNNCGKKVTHVRKSRGDELGRR